MRLRDAFNIQRKVTKITRPSRGDGGAGTPSTASTLDNTAAADVAAAAQTQTRAETQGVFLTPQSLTSFTGASGVVALFWSVANVIDSRAGESKLVALIIALIVGAILYLISESDESKAPETPRQKAIGVFIALVNSLLLFSAAIGWRDIPNIGTAAESGVVEARTAAPATDPADPAERAGT